MVNLAGIFEKYYISKFDLKSIFQTLDSFEFKRREKAFSNISKLEIDLPNSGF